MRSTHLVNLSGVAAQVPDQAALTPHIGRSGQRCAKADDLSVTDDDKPWSADDVPAGPYFHGTRLPIEPGASFDLQVPRKLLPDYDFGVVNNRNCADRKLPTGSRRKPIVIPILGSAAQLWLA